MKGASKIKKFGSKVKTYAQVLGIKYNDSSNDRQKQRIHNKKKEEAQTDRKEISKLNETINALQAQVNELLKLIHEIVKDKYNNIKVQRKIINEKVQNISLIEAKETGEENTGSIENNNYKLQKKRSINRKESLNNKVPNQNQFRPSGSCKN